MSTAEASRRPLTLDDAAAIADILAAIEEAEPADAHWNADEVAEDLTSPSVDLPRASIGLLDGDRLVGFGVVFAATPTDVWQGYLWGGVHPGYARRGLGSRILRDGEAAALDLAADQAPGLPVNIKIGVEDTRVSTAALSAAAGYEPWRWFFRMQRDLADPVESPGTVDGFELRRYRPADEEATRLASNASFADHWGSTPQSPERWRAAFSQSTYFRPQHSFVAVASPRAAAGAEPGAATGAEPGAAAGTVAAFVLAEEYDSETAARGYVTGYASRVGTVREARGRGLASALLRLSLASMAEAGYDRAELGVDADSPTGAGRIYERAGFAVVARETTYGRRFPPGAGPAPVDPAPAGPAAAGADPR